MAGQFAWFHGLPEFLGILRELGANPSDRQKVGKYLKCGIARRDQAGAGGAFQS